MAWVRRRFAGRNRKTFYLVKDHCLMPYDDYESVAGLDAAEQRALLYRGDAVERIWAAWSLALKFGPQIVPDLRRSLRGSPSGGTRRHLIVVLAGMGERRILEESALGDPDEWVRATAAQYLLRISAGPIDPHFLDRVLNDPSPVVQESVRQEIDDRPPMGTA